MNFKIVKANIATIKTDAIVLPANKSLKEGAGASKAIFEAAGRKQLTDACKKIGTCEVGSAVLTSAFNLDAKYIVHAVVPKWVDGNHEEYDLLSTTYLSALTIADVLGCETIAFPLLASGHNGYDMQLAFQIAKESIESFEATKLQQVILVVFGNHITETLREKGYTVEEEQVHEEHKPVKKSTNQQILNKVAKEGKAIMLDFADDQIQKAVDYLKDEKNREKLVEQGIKIVKRIITK